MLVGCRDRVIELKNDNRFITQVEIGNEVGVSRERVRQILNKVGLNNASEIREKKKRERTCAYCGNPRSRNNHKYCSRACACKAHRVDVTCEECGSTVNRTLSETKVYENYRNRHKHFFCDRVCFGKWVGKNYGFGTYPEHTGRTRKYDYEKIINMKESGYGNKVIAGMIGAPEGTIACIIHRCRKGEVVA